MRRYSYKEQRYSEEAYYTRRPISAQSLSYTIRSQVRSLADASVLMSVILDVPTILAALSRFYC